MDFIDVDEPEHDRNFWYLSVTFIYLSAVLQLGLGEFVSGFSTLIMGIALTFVAYHKLRKE